MIGWYIRVSKTKDSTVDCKHKGKSVELRMTRVRRVIIVSRLMDQNGQEVCGRNTMVDMQGMQSRVGQAGHGERKQAIIEKDNLR